MFRAICLQIKGYVDPLSPDKCGICYLLKSSQLYFEIEGAVYQTGNRPLTSIGYAKTASIILIDPTRL
ncbi:hypothetical protein HI914_03210 [Erysiphe necator]|nr:hypothetical protein HI914_03210 [Erysiphe necator]